MKYWFSSSDVTKAFKRGFNDVNGRWTGFEFSNTELKFTIKGDIGELACDGCRIEWVDFYKWNDNNNVFELDNSSHRDEFSSLLNKYDAYKIDGSSSQSQQTFSRARKTIEKIIDGENISFR